MENIFEIVNGTLVHCTINDPKVVIPDGVKVIGEYAFRQPDSIYGLDNIESVIVPESVEEIESSAFSRCKNLKKVKILGPAMIGREAFISCSKLKEVYLADGVRGIGGGCFAYCEKIEEIYIPLSVTFIGWDIAGQNDSSYRYPRFLCYRKGNGENWHKHWNLIYNDPRFGDDEKHHFYHPTLYGMTREGTPRTDLEHVPCTDMPHGTGQYIEEPPCGGTCQRLPPTRLRLWFTATLKSMVGEKEYHLDSEEREVLPRMIRDSKYDYLAPKPLDKPWEITIDDDTRQLAPTSNISAWINDLDDIFDGQTLIVHHDMPFHTSPYDDYPISKLTKGATVIAEKYIINNLNIYDVRLHIQWLEEDPPRYTLSEAFELIKESASNWKLDSDDKGEIEVHLAHGCWKAEKYKIYKPSEFPEKFICDLTEEGDTWSNLGQIVLRPYEYYQQLHEYSDDYKDAASAYGQDCDDWYTTERRPLVNHISIEIKKSND